jgi:uncharacterized protein
MPTSVTVDCHDLFPHRTRYRAHVRPLKDGTMLAARIWTMPNRNLVPAILGYLPYRKRDGTYERDALTHAPPV